MKLVDGIGARTRQWRTAIIFACALAQPVAGAFAADAARPVPGHAEQAAAEKLVRQVYEDDLAKRSPADRSATAQKLIDAADKSGDDRAGRYVLLNDARELAISAGDPARAWAAIDALGSSFTVNVDTLQTDTLLALSKATLTPPAAGEAAKDAAQLADHLCESNDYAAAQRVLSQAESFAIHSRNPQLLATTRTRAADVRSLAIEYDRARAAFDKLKQTPDDAQANLTTGSFLCFTKGDWTGGVAYLQRGSDPVLKQAAAAEQANPTTAAGFKDLGDKWWDASDKKAGAVRQSMRRRAAEWYTKALPGLSGLAQELVGKRIGEADAASGIDLLSMIDIKRDGMAGQWTIENGVLITHPGVPKLRVPFKPATAYDLRISFADFGDAGGLVAVCPTGKKSFTVEVTPDTFYFGDGVTHFIMSPHVKIAKKQTATLLVRVRKDLVQGYLDDKLMAEFKPEEKALGTKGPWFLGDDSALGIGSWDTTLAFLKMTVTDPGGLPKTASSFRSMR